MPSSTPVWVWQPSLSRLQVAERRAGERSRAVSARTWRWKTLIWVHISVEMIGLSVRAFSRTKPISAVIAVGLEASVT